MTNSKVCFKCKETKKLSEFYAHPMMADGHLNKCKGCAKRDVTQHREQNIDRIRAYDRARGTLPKRAKAAAAISAAWLKEDRRRSAAHNAVAKAIRAGTLTRLPCVACGNAKSYAHHDDYDKKLDVIFLCQPCHKARHKILKAEGRNP